MQKSFTDIFIKRPVLACVVSLLLFVLGLASVFKLSLQQYPQMENTVITVTTAYPGASAQVVKGFITTPLEKSIGSANGIDYLDATSAQGVSTINVHVQLNYSPDSALTEVTGKVNAVLDQLPSEAKSPIIQKQTGATMPDIILGFTSKTMTPEQISAYLANVVSPKINSVGGISQIQIWGEKDYAMRVWLNPGKMALLGVTPQDVQSALTNNNVIATAGQIKSNLMYIPINLATDLHTVDEFKQLVVMNQGGHLIRLQDVAHVELGSDDYDHEVYYNGSPALFLGITSAPGANPLSVVHQLLKAMPEIQKAFPSGLHESTVYNMTDYIQVALDEVIQTLIEATIIVMLVIFLFLGTFRSMLIPVLTIPLSLVGVCTFMLALGFSLNLLTLLAMVLAIGMVVDDAIVVLENIYRHVEEGLTPFQAAIKGAREITGPVIVMTTTLVAVFAPIALVGGLTGALFIEFATTLALTVVLSGVIALTLSPMVCSKVITPSMLHSPLVKKIDHFFEKFKHGYRRMLHGVLKSRSVVIFISILVLILCGVMAKLSPSELAPTEDQNFIMILAFGPDSANLPFLKQYNAPIEHLLKDLPGVEGSFQIDGYPYATGIMAGVIFKEWSQRNFTQMQVYPKVNQAVSRLPGMQALAIQMPSLPGVAQGAPIQMILSTTGDYPQLYKVAQQFIQAAQATGKFAYISSDLKFDQPQLNVKIDQQKAADLGITMNQIASAMNTLFGGNLVNYFTYYGYSYQVIPQVPDDWRVRAEQINQIYLRTQSGDLIPLSALVSFTVTGEPPSLYQFQQLNSTSLSIVPMMPMGQAIQVLQGIANKLLPKGFTYDYTGQSRQYVQESGKLGMTFLLAIIIIYLVLAAQFESFRDPFIILISVPMSIFGALIPVFLGAATLNIYTEIGLITLIGLISKHGILMVEFANKQQELFGFSKREAIEEAAAIRLRPILMTTVAMVVGVLPLVMATGAGAVSRNNVGLVIACGMAIGTVFTLFVVPTVYTFLAKDRQAMLAKIARTQIMPPEDESEK